MDTEPLLSSPSNTHQLQKLLEDGEDEEISFQSHLVSVAIDEENPFVQSSSPQPGQPLLSITSRQKSGLHRSRTAPAMSAMRCDLNDPQQRPPHLLESSGSIYIQAVAFLLAYLVLGVLIYCFNRDHFSGAETHFLVDALYFSIVTMCTIGYGDITPLTPAAKVFACAFVIFGFGFLDVLLSTVVHRVLDLQESMILESIRAGGGRGNHILANNYVVDTQKGRMRIRMKVALALLAVVSCIGTGTLVLLFVEGLNWVDSFYLSVMSVTTVGYGDRAFKTMPGRLFASFWLLLSTLLVARAFMYLAEARVDKRHRRIAKLVLQRDMTVEDLLAADVNNNGFISKSEYVLYKLREMGKISENDILQICTQFNKLDPNNSGKIKLPDLAENSR